MYAAAAQNQVVTEGNLVPREVAPVVGPSVNFGAGATPADGTNRTPPSSCCPPPHRGGFCSAPQSDPWGRTVESPSLSQPSGCDSPALLSTAESDHRAWCKYLDMWREITRLEVKHLRTDDPPELIALRAAQSALFDQVDRHLSHCSHCRGNRA